MTKSYVKDARGKYRLVDKQEPHAQPLTVEQRLKRLEEILLVGGVQN